MRQYQLLDLFCGVGGASVGYWNAGFDVFGVDLDAQPEFPFQARFFQLDAISALESVLKRTEKDGISPFQVITASPPCQAWSNGTPKWAKENYPQLIQPVRELLNSIIAIDSSVVYVIENVPCAKKEMISPIVLCGTMFPQLKVIRHRLFESNIPLVGIDKHSTCKKLVRGVDYFTVAGHWGRNGDISNWSTAMGMTWTRKEHSLVEAIPPMYTEYIGKQVIKYLEGE